MRIVNIQKSVILPTLMLGFLVFACDKNPAGDNKDTSKRSVSEAKADILSAIQDYVSNGQIIIGQQCRDGNAFTNGYQDLVLALEEQTGKTVTLVGADFGWDYQTDINRLALDLISHWNKGGLITASWHIVNPWNGKSCRDKNIGKMEDLISPHNAAYIAWRQDLTKVATALKLLKDSGAVLIWRPLHEMNGDWFWWCNRDRDAYIALWRDMYRFLVDENQLDNLIWVYSPNAVYSGSSLKDVMFYYPGDDYVDVVGEDIYRDDPQTYGYALYREKVPDKPYVIGEYGSLNKRGSLDNMIPINAFKGKAGYYLQWHSWFGNPVAIIDNPNADQVMNHTDVITLDEFKY